MENEIFRAGNYTAKVVRCNTAIVGSGAAGFNAADRLWQQGQHDIVLVTENRVGGTSRNTGSDKQTYYKLTLSGGEPDSVREMADTLFAGRCVDGDIALCEAALSTQCFLKLVELGVPFPRNRYGEYIGYKTDHDPRRRATSVGPYTSKQMTECLEAAVQAKVYLDYRKNPVGGAFSYDALLPEAREYLTRAGACFGTPIERLAQMNQPAIDFYRDKGVDLYTQPLEIALCAQHNNGGIGIDCWWQTNVKGLFAVGEAAASHGVYRPGGTALNAGQVGSTRAAQYIAVRCQGDAPACFDTEAAAALTEMAALADACRADTGNVRALWQHAAEEMSRCGAAIRDPAQIRAYGKQVEAQLADFAQTVKAGSRTELAMLYRLRDMLLSQRAYLTAMTDYTAHGGKSRGSALYTDLTGGVKPFAQLPDTFTFALDETESPLIQELWFEDGTCRTAWRAPRPIPEDDDFFENVWRSYRETGNID